MTIYQSFIHDYTYTANCLFDSQSPTRRRPVADQSPTSCRPITTYFQSVGNQSPTSRRPIADWSPILEIVVADQSPIDLQPKNAVFDRTVVALVAAVFQSQGSRRQVAVHVWPGLYCGFVRVKHRGSVDSLHKGPLTFPWNGVIINHQSLASSIQQTCSIEMMPGRF